MLRLADIYYQKYLDGPSQLALRLHYEIVTLGGTHISDDDERGLRTYVFKDGSKLTRAWNDWNIYCKEI